MISFLFTFFYYSDGQTVIVKYIVDNVCYSLNFSYNQPFKRDGSNSGKHVNVTPIFSLIISAEQVVIHRFECSVYM